MFLKKRSFSIIFFLFLFSLLYLLISQGSFIINFSEASSIDPRDQGCYDRGGQCLTFNHTRSYGSCTVDGKSGYIQPNLCNSKTDQNYRCCRPIEEDKNSGCIEAGGKCIFLSHTSPTGTCTVDGKSGTIKANLCNGAVTDYYRCCVPDQQEEEDRVYADNACDYLGGQCQWTTSGGRCSVGGETGCYVFGACRAEPHNMREDQLYLCCTTDEEFCGGEVDYTLWEDIYINGNCPFSKPSLGDDRLWCSQGPETSPSHQGYAAPSVDITLGSEGTPGTEYFIAPEGGYITKAKAFYTEGNQRCGCLLEFETDGGVIYEIRHCFLFTGISTHFHPSGDPLGEPIRIEKGIVLARIALDSDTQVIQHGYGCSTAPHFHVRVTGNVDRCVDCHFVDKLGCNLFNDGSRSDIKGLCGRCWRASFPTSCFGSGRVASWGGVRCDNVLAGCAGCDVNTRQYCCETDRVWCCIETPTGEICDWVCDCPHSSSGGSSGFRDEGSETPNWRELF